MVLSFSYKSIDVEKHDMTLYFKNLGSNHGRKHKSYDSNSKILEKQAYLCYGNLYSYQDEVLIYENIGA